MSKKPERRFWRIHLSTAIVSALIILPIAIANLRGVHRVPRFDPADNSPFDEFWFLMPRTMFGWPIRFLYIFDDKSTSVGSFYLDGLALIVDVVVWTTLLSLPVLQEWFIRRREGRKT